MSSDDDLLARVRARRAAREGRTGIAAERAAGMAPHRQIGGITQSFANRCLRSVTDELHSGEFLAVRDPCIQAVLDGYELAAALSPATADPPKAFGRAADATRFENRVCSSGEALHAGPLAPIARALIDDRLGAVPEALRPVAERVFAHGIAAGALLRVHEHGVRHPALDALAPAPAPKKRKVGPEPQQAPPNPELTARILAAPDDDEPRLVYADWLTEHGDPLGEFILVQCALGRAVHGAGAKYVSSTGRKLPFEARQDLEAREKELLKAHERTWLAPIRPYVRFWGFQRGFVHEVTADAAAFLDGLDALREVPLAGAKLTGFVPALAARFAAAAPHPTLRDLDLSRNRIDARTIGMVASPFFSRLRSLELWGNPLGDAGLGVLAAAPLPALRSLRLMRVGATDTGFQALTGALFWPALTDLEARWNTLGPDTVAELVARFGERSA